METLDPLIILSGESETRMELPLMEESIFYSRIPTQVLDHFTWDASHEQTLIHITFYTVSKQRIIGTWDIGTLT